MADILESTRREVEELHAFFERWYTGRHSVDLKRVSSVLAAEFNLHSPSGRRLSKEVLLRELEADRGAFPALRISIENLQASDAGDGTVTAEYTEAHLEGTQSERRTCRAVLRRCVNDCNGLEWLSINERPEA
jgi:hypothetical protein